MGAGESKEPIVVPAVPPVAEVTSSLDNPEEKFQEEVRKAAGQFKSLVQGNKVMMFSATYCSYCSVAKVGWNSVTICVARLTCKCARGRWTSSARRTRLWK